MFKKVAKSVVVLGMHRSGTSALANVLHSMGVDMGKEMYGPDRGNPDGHFEDISFLNLNEAILAAAGGSWHSPPSDFQIRVFGSREGQRLIDLVVDRKKKGRPWGFKDPRTCLTLPLYMPHLSDAYFIVIDRDCADVARSLNNRDGDSFHFEHDNLQLCKEYKNRFNATLNEFHPSRVLRISFDELMGEPAKTVAKLNQYLQLGLQQSQIDLAASKIKQSRHNKI